VANAHRAPAPGAGAVLNPWVLLGALGLWLASMVGAFNFGRDHEIGAQAREDQTRTETREAAREGVAEALAKIEVQRVEITQPIQTIVRERTVYRECLHDADVVRGINAALTGSSRPVDRGQLPAASAPR
jgi:hypothetical protein